MFSENLEKALSKKTTHDVLDDMWVEQAKFYVPNEPIDPDNVDKVGKVVISSVVSEVPIFGSLLSGLLDLFWPGGRDDDWGSMRPMVEALIDDKNGQQDAEHNRDLLNGLHRRLRDYLALPDNVKIQELHEFVNRTTDVVPSFVDNKSPWYSLPYLVRFGTLRLSALWTRWHFCEEIDKTSSSKQYYEDELVRGVNELVDAVLKAKRLCIDRRKGQIKIVDTQSPILAYRFDLEDPHTQAKLKCESDTGYPISDEEKIKVQELFQQATGWVYGEELERTCAPIKLWEQFLPDYVPKVRVELYRQNRGWVWNHITPQATPFDTRSYRDRYGELNKISWYHIEDSYYLTRRVVGIELLYGDVPFHIGGKLGQCTTMEIGKNEVVLSAKAKVSKGYYYYEQDTLETIEFTKVRPTIDKQGRMRYDYFDTWTNGRDNDIPRSGITYVTFSHDGEVSKPYPTFMLSAVGWSYNHDSEGYIGNFQPVFGCLETVGKDGLSTWSLDKPGFSQ